MGDHGGLEPGDPAKAAQAVLKAADAPDPPRHLLLGADALKYATAHRDALWADIEAWKADALAIGLDA